MDLSDLPELTSGFVTLLLLRIKPWIRVGLALVTMAVFVRSLLEFLGRYA